MLSHIFLIMYHDKQYIFTAFTHYSNKLEQGFFLNLIKNGMKLHTVDTLHFKTHFFAHNCLNMNVWVKYI